MVSDMIKLFRFAVLQPPRPPERQVFGICGLPCVFLISLVQTNSCRRHPCLLNIRNPPLKWFCVGLVPWALYDRGSEHKNTMCAGAQCLISVIIQHQSKIFTQNYRKSTFCIQSEWAIAVCRGIFCPYRLHKRIEFLYYVCGIFVIFNLEIIYPLIFASHNAIPQCTDINNMSQKTQLDHQFSGREKPIEELCGQIPETRVVW